MAQRPTLDLAALLKSYCTSHPDALVCLARDRLETSNGKCYTEFIRQILTEGQLDKNRLRAAIQKVIAEAGLPSSPIRSIAKTVMDDFTRGVNGFIFSVYLPITILFLVAIWLMVIAKWITPVTGILLTIALLIIMIAFGIAYSVMIRSWTFSRLQKIVKYVDNEVETITNAANALPGLLNEAVCSYVNASPAPLPDTTAPPAAPPAVPPSKVSFANPIAAAVGAMKTPAAKATPAAKVAVPPAASTAVETTVAVPATTTTTTSTYSTATGGHGFFGMFGTAPTPAPVTPAMAPTPAMPTPVTSMYPHVEGAQENDVMKVQIVDNSASADESDHVPASNFGELSEESLSSEESDSGSDSAVSSLSSASPSQ